MLDQLALDGVGVARVREHVFFELDRRFPEPDLQQHHPQRVDVVDLAEHLFGFPLSFGVPVDVLGGDEVGGAGAEEGFGAREVEAHHPWVGEFDFVAGGGGGEEEDVFAAEGFVDLRFGSWLEAN